MHSFLANPGTFWLLFALLLVLFNWPILSIPGPGSLFIWLFALWAAAIFLILGTALAARGAQPSQSGGPDGDDV